MAASRKQKSGWVYFCIFMFCLNFYVVSIFVKHFNLLSYLEVFVLEQIDIINIEVNKRSHTNKFRSWDLGTETSTKEKAKRRHMEIRDIHTDFTLHKCHFSRVTFYLHCYIESKVPGMKLCQGRKWPFMGFQNRIREQVINRVKNKIFAKAQECLKCLKKHLMVLHVFHFVTVIKLDRNACVSAVRIFKAFFYHFPLMFYNSEHFQGDYTFTVKHTAVFN